MAESIVGVVLSVATFVVLKFLRDDRVPVAGLPPGATEADVW